VPVPSISKFFTFAAFSLLIIGLGAVAAAGQAAGGYAGQTPPGPLSPGHAVSPGTNCQACHGAGNKVLPEKCLACHKEISRQAGAPKGYHRDKQDSCADCHAEHQGAGKSIVPLDVKDFDHSETGTVPAGAHQKVVGCDRCHRPDNTLARTQAKSYILKDPGCRSCHRPPHPGRQDDCLACHDQNSWSVDRLNGGQK
jgi:hypothetical protein